MDTKGSTGTSHGTATEAIGEISHNKVQDTNLSYSLRPLTICSYIFGLMFICDRRRLKLSIASITYHLLVHLGIGAIVLLYFRVYHYRMPFGPSLTLTLNSHASFIWIWLGLSNQTRLSRLWKPTEQQWVQYWEEYDVNSKRSLVKMRTASVAVTVVSIALTVFLIGVMINELVFKQKSVLEGLYKSMLIFPGQDQLDIYINISMQIVCGLYKCAAYVLPLNHLMVICTGLWYEFNTLNRDLNALIRSSNEVVAQLEHFRQRHLALNTVVQRADDMFSFFTLSWLLIAVASICFNIYTLIISISSLELNVYGRLVLCLLPSTTIPLVGVLSMTIAGTNLHEEVRHLHDNLYVTLLILHHSKYRHVDIVD